MNLGSLYVSKEKKTNKNDIIQEKLNVPTSVLVTLVTFKTAKK
jgi:hypothetical protein